MDPREYLHGEWGRRSTWTDPERLAAARRIVNLAIIAWSVLRIAACGRRGLDVEGWMAMAVLVVAVRSVTFARHPSSPRRPTDEGRRQGALAMPRRAPPTD